MSQQDFTLLGAALVVFALTVSVLASLAALRGAREHRNAVERAEQTRDRAIQMHESQLRAKDVALASLREEVAFLRELEGVRFAERYQETKNGLELRLRSLESQQERWGERAREVQRGIEELSLTGEQKSGEMARLRAELARTQLDGRTLEEALRAVSTLGEIPMTDLREALSRVRRRQTEIAGRLDQLGLEGEEKASERDRLKLELERARGEASRLAREIEITRAAGPMLDGLLGVTQDMQKKLVRLEDQLERSLRSLNGVRGHDPFAGFIEAVGGAARDPELPSVGARGNGHRHPGAGSAAGSNGHRNGTKADAPAHSAGAEDSSAGAPYARDANQEAAASAIAQTAAPAAAAV